MNRFSAPVATSSLLLADVECGRIQDLISGSKAPVQALAPQAPGSVLGQISEGLRQQRKAGVPVRTLHLIAHGRPGAFRIGNVWIDAEALKAHANELAHWGVETIALWSCHVGADADFVALLAELSGAQVLASADWLGRDEEGHEQLRLGAWSLADLLEPKTWPASFRLDVSIEKADGSGICAEDELLFKATADGNGYVSVTFDLNENQPLPPGGQLFFSATGQGDWKEYTNGYLAKLSESSEGYFKVKLPDDTLIGTKLNAEIRQFEIDLGADNPVIDVGKLQLNADGAKEMVGNIPGPAGEWGNGLTGNGKEYKLAYRYEDFLPQLKTLGYRLEADVGLKFSGDVQKYKFDDTEAFGGGGDASNSLKRLQTRLNGNTRSGANVSHTMTFYLVDAANKRTQVSLENFWVNPVDIDSFKDNANDSAEFFEIPDIGVAKEGSPDAATSGVVYELPTPLGGNGEKGPDSNNGTKNMIRFGKDGGLIRFHGARKWDAYNGDGDKATSPANRSNVPGASVLLDYRDPVKELKFNVGTSGNTAVGADGSKRFFSTALGNAFTVGVPEGDFVSDTASITLEDCFDFYITASAACIEEASAAGVAAQSDDLFNEASFTFDVIGGKAGSQEKESLEGEYVYEITVDSERVGTKYANYSLRFEDEFGELLGDDEVLFESKKYGDGSGILSVKEGVEDFRVVFDVIPRSPGDQLVGDESVTLELTHKETGKNDEATASLEDELGCDPVGSNPAFTITATAACIKEEGGDDSASAATVASQNGELLDEASFTFSVKGALAPGSREPESLKGDYTYVLAVNGERVGTKYAGYDYRIEGRNGEDLSSRIVSVDEGRVGDGVGALFVKQDISELRIVFDVNALAEGDQLTGDESVTLSLERNEVVNSYAFATASLADELGCDPLVDPDDQQIFLEPFAACVKDGVLSSSTAEFVFNGEFKPSTTESREVGYVIDTSSGLLDGDYAFNLQFSDGISLKEGGATGVMEVDEGVGDFSIEITAAAADSLTGDESITLTLYDDSEVVTKTASLAKLDCAPTPDELGKTDVALYLLMDSSTSMLQSDPSTALAGQANRLESQDRVSLYSYQQALEKAGYGFSRKGESGVLSTAAFKDAVINNSAADLAEVLNDFEVIVDPNNSGKAQDLTLHLISYGYAVDYGSFTITADDPSAGKQAAEAIVGLQTPDQIYGNSIDGNTLWSERGLPVVNGYDMFWGEGRPASNLYSGTEMLGALEGLEHLLAAQLNRGAADPITTYISMTTDGRPERRPWWDTRKGSGSDSLTGEDVRLPVALGRDAITTSGLIYSNDGEAIFLNNNEGEQQWTAMQNRLNATLDAIAAQQPDPSNRLQVSVLGMGDGSDANFPAIYSDLFGLRTFNNSKGGWSYDYFTSYALPDFVG